jgi:hypothetical protein
LDNDDLDDEDGDDVDDNVAPLRSLTLVMTMTMMMRRNTRKIRTRMSVMLKVVVGWWWL